MEVVAGGRPLELGGAKQRAVLAVLLLHRGEVVSTDRLIDDLWADQPPATAAKTVQVYVSHLRKALGEGVLDTRGPGYALLVEPSQLDAGRFEQLASEGRRLADGDASAASKVFREALALWRGPPLADFAYQSFAQTDIARLEEARLSVLEDRIDSDLALGHHQALCGELEALTEQHPLRERLQGQLMLALYRSGRQAEALDRYREVSRMLREELGIEPGRSLQALHGAILDQDPELDPPARSSGSLARGPTSRLRRGAVAVIAVGLLVLAGAVGAILTRSKDGVDVSANSVALIDPGSGEVSADLSVGARPADIAAASGAVWVANLDDDSISEIDPASRAVVSTTASGASIDGMAAGPSGVWIADVQSGFVSNLSPSFHRITGRVRISTAPNPAHVAGPVALGAGSVWAGTGNAAVARIDPEAARLRARIDAGNDPAAIAVGAGSVWVADDIDGTVSRIDPRSAAVTATIPVGEGPSAIAVGEGSVWVADSQDDQVVRLDPATGATTATIAVGRRPTGIAVGAGAVWVANSVSGTVSRIDPGSGAVDLTVSLGQSPHGVIADQDGVWVTVQAATPAPAVDSAGDGQTAHVLLTQDPADVDPAHFFSDYQRAYATCARLYNYPDQPAPGGSTLAPEVAAGAPEVSPDGRTYTFTVRPGYRFSPPSNEAVTAASFERAIERALSPKLKSYAATFMGDIAGAKAYISGRTERLSGVEVHGDQLVVRLTAPAPDFVARISSPWFCAVPPDTPISSRGVETVPSAGPYYVSSYVPGKSIVVLRNPNYDGPRPSQLAEIDYEIGVPGPRAVAEVEAGDADYYTNAVLGSSFTPDDLDRLDARYGPRSAAATAGAQQYFLEPQLGVYYLLFNTHRPPFDDPKLRRAVNYAIDRPALARDPFPDVTGRPTDQYIPPGMPGFRDRAIYPLGGPDLARARQLAAGTHARAVLYACNLPSCSRFAQTVRANLARIGIEVDVRQFAIADLFRRIQTPGEPFDLAQYNYFSDYPDPSDFINYQFQTTSSSLGLFSDPALDARMAAAATLSGNPRYQAYARLDHDLVADAAPAAAFASATSANLFSARIGCQVNQPIYGIDLGLLCVR